MTEPTIRLVTDDDMRAIDSRNLAAIEQLPALYIALSHTAPSDTDPDAMKYWVPAHELTLAQYVSLYPDALVAPHSFGWRASRGDLLYHGAKPAVDFLPRP